MLPMARRAERLLPAEYALLGLLAAEPAHGYDLHRAFAPGGALADVVRLPQIISTPCSSDWRRAA